MNDALRVHVSEPLEKHRHVCFDMRLGKRLARIPDHGRKVGGHKFENENKRRAMSKHPLQAHDVRMFQRSQGLDFAERFLRNCVALGRPQSDAFERHLVAVFHTKGMQHHAKGALPDLPDDVEVVHSTRHRSAQSQCSAV
eukprot:Amastigsp_a177868_6.p4 type:complete len:140 gc:universal Amastigsp_a177868_6:435-16(-)